MECIVNPPLQGEGDRAAQRRGGGGSASLRKPVVYKARRLRREMSPPEVQLWQHLRGSPNGIRFRRQHPIGDYVVDFYCSKARLVIEIDGRVHDGAARAEHDERRDRYLKDRGLQVYRVAAAEVLKDSQKVADAVVALAARPLHRACGTVPLPVDGEDLA